MAVPPPSPPQPPRSRHSATKKP